MIDLSERLGDEELRYQLREKVLADTFLFNKIVMGYPDIDLDPHYSMCEFIDAQEHKRRLLLAPRGTIKSWLTRGWIIQQAMIDPNIRVLYVMHSETAAKTASRSVDQVFRNNKMLKWLFPDRIPEFGSGTWGLFHRTIPRTTEAGEPTYTFCGVGTGQAGNHYDIIVCDDVIEEEAAESTTVMQAVIYWFSNVEPLLDELSPKAQVFVVGTRWKLVDLYSVIMGEKKQNTNEKLFRAEGDPAFICMKRMGMEGGKPFWERKFSKEKLAIKKAALESKGQLDRYYLWYMNNPIAEENCEFPRHMIRYWNWSSNGKTIVLNIPDSPQILINPKSLRYTLAVDPAFEKGSQFDESAISIIGSHPRGYRILIHAWTGQVGVHLLRAKIIGLIRSFYNMEIPIALFCIEKVAGQRTLIPFVKDEMVRLGVYAKLKEDIRRAPNVEKNNFIRSFLNIVAGGWYYTHRQFLEPNMEMETFPNGKKNFLDTLGYQLQLWTPIDHDENENVWYDEDDEDDEIAQLVKRGSGYGG